MYIVSAANMMSQLPEKRCDDKDRKRREKIFTYPQKQMKCVTQDRKSVRERKKKY